jgi:hypothetical protein
MITVMVVTEHTNVFQPQKSQKKCTVHASCHWSDRIWVNIVRKNGYFERIPALEGETLLQAFERQKVADLPGTIRYEVNVNSRSLMLWWCRVAFHVRKTNRSFDCRAAVWKLPCDCFWALDQKVGWTTWDRKVTIGRDFVPNLLKVTPWCVWQRCGSSRLACCIVMEKWMNEMIVTIGPTDNFFEEQA